MKKKTKIQNHQNKEQANKQLAKLAVSWRSLCSVRPAQN